MRFRIPAAILALLVAGSFLVACGDDTSDPLEVKGVEPRQVRSGSESFVMIIGSGFEDGASVQLGGRPLAQVTFVSSALLTAVVPAGLESGGYPVSVTLPDGASARGDAPITVINARPEPTPTPRPTPAPTPTPTPEPTRAPTRTPAPTATPTPEPTREPTVRPTATPAPTQERTPTRTATPTRTPTRAPDPSAEPTRTPTVRDILERNLPGADRRMPPGRDDQDEDGD